MHPNNFEEESTPEGVVEEVKKKPRGRPSKRTPVSVEPDNFLPEEQKLWLTEEASKAGISVLEFVKTAVRFYLEKSPKKETGVTTVVLKIPKEISDSSEVLQNWLNLRTNMIIKQLYDKQKSS